MESFAGPGYFIDQAFPTVISINRSNGAGPSTTASSVDFTVAFSKPVTGVSASNFAIAADPGVAAGVISVSPIDGATYTVHLSGISGSGSLGLNLANSAGIHDTAGNPLGSSTGTVAFAAQQTIAVGQQPRVVLAGDVNSDGAADVVIGNSVGNLIGVFPGSSWLTILSTGDLTPRSPRNFSGADGYHRRRKARRCCGRVSPGPLRC